VTPERDEAREDTARYHKALIAHRTDEALRIERKYQLDGHPPLLVAIGLHAASEGRNVFEAIDEYLEDEEA
jgi:hypothetical protein